MTDTSSSFFSIPIPPAVRRIFDAFPLRTLPPNPLPARCPTSSEIPSLYVFSTPQHAIAQKPSFNPACLKWQTYLRLCGVEYRSVPSNNHASPSGSLPFLIPGTASGSDEARKPVTSGGLVQWVKENGKPPSEMDPTNPELVAFTALIDTRIRDAWLYALYLEPRNFSDVAIKHYCQTNVAIVRKLLGHEYRTAAYDELCKFRPGGLVSASDLYADADAAFQALATLLDENGGDWFFGMPEPGLFDATVYAYTHLILTIPWDDKAATLQRSLRKYTNLVAHERRIHERTFGRARRKKSQSSSSRK